MGGRARTLAPRAGVRAFVWALGAPPAARVARVTQLRGASEARRSPLSGCPPSVQGFARRCCRVCGCGGPVLSPWLACPVGAACRGGRGGPSPGGMACHRCEGRLASGAVPPAAARSLGRAARVPRPVCPTCGWRGRGDPAPVPPRVPLWPGVARCGVGGRASPGGYLSPLSGASEVRRSPCRGCPLGCRGPLPTCCGRGCEYVGAQHCPLGLHALWGLRAAGALRSRARECRPATVMRGVWCQALSLSRPPVLWGEQPGPRDPCVPDAVGVGVGTQHRSHSVRPCGLALHAVGAAGGHPPGGDACCRFQGRLRSGASPSRSAHPPGGLSGSARYVLWARVCGCGSPALSPWLACPVGAACRGAGGGPFPGGWPATVMRVSGVRRCPSPSRPSSGAGGRGSATRVSRVRLARAWGPSTGPAACAFTGRRCALWGWPKGVPGGGAFRRFEGRLRSGARPPPTARPPGGLSGSTTHMLWARVCGCGGPALSPWFACPVGAACRGGGGGPCPGGWPPTVVRGVWCQALSLPLPPVL